MIKPCLCELDIGYPISHIYYKFRDNWTKVKYPQSKNEPIALLDVVVVGCLSRRLVVVASSLVL